MKTTYDNKAMTADKKQGYRTKRHCTPGGDSVKKETGDASSKK
jgi:uncharacterized protein YegP (UPF0339 family)